MRLRKGIGVRTPDGLGIIQYVEFPYSKTKRYAVLLFDYRLRAYWKKELTIVTPNKNKTL